MASRPSYPSWPSGRGLPRPGEEIGGKYRVGELLGIGGMGAVFEAEELASGRRVAIKVLRPEETETTDALGRFMREARAASTIDSPHVVRVFELDTLDNGLPYMVLELLQGNRLDTVIKKLAPLPVAVAVGYLLQACEGLAAAHARGFIHRDLKPSNLFVTRGPQGEDFIKVLDFGIAKATGRLDPNTDGLSLTESSSTLGSPQYMSPEQLRCSKSVDARTDIWPLGLILHKMLTGRAAFEADSVGAQFAMIVSDPPTPLRTHAPELSVELERIVACCLEKSPEHRYQDVAQLAEALLPFARESDHARVAQIRGALDQAGVSSPRLPAPRVTPSGRGLADAVVPDELVTQEWRRDEGGATARSWDASQRAGAGRRTAPWLLVAAAGVTVLLALGSYGWWRVTGSAERAAGATAVPAGDTSGAHDAEGDSVHISLVIEPDDAQVLLDGALTRNNPITLVRSERIYVIVVKAPGYVAERREVSAERDATVEIKLAAAAGDEAESEPEPAAATGRPSHPPTGVSRLRGADPSEGKSPAEPGSPEITPQGPWSDEL